MNAKKDTSKSTWVDPDDSPEWTEEMFQRADLYHGDKLIRRGKGRPAGTSKTSVTTRVDTEVLDAFKATGRGWQTKINAALKDYLRRGKLRAKLAG